MTTTSTHETEIIADPDVPLVRIIREFDAPPEKVFRAHTDPELVVQWLGPRGLEMRDRPLRLPHRRRRTATCTAATARSTASTAASTRCARPSSSCRPSPSRACPTAWRWRSCVLEDLGDGRTRLDGHLAGRLLRGPRRLRRQRHGGRRPRGLRAPRRAARRLTCRRVHCRWQGRELRVTALTRFSPATRAWFEAAFAEPTTAQVGAWEAISAGSNALVVAPTGSGKTLAAFLWSPRPARRCARSR